MRRICLLALAGLSTLAAAHEPPAGGPAGSSADAAPARARPGQTLPLAPARTIAIDTDEGTWLSPDIAPDGKTIAFELLGDIYLVDARRGGRARPLTHGMAFDSQPVFSPDGRTLAFLSDRSGADNIWLADLRSGRLRQVTFRDDDFIFVSPGWSGDGRSLFVSRARPDMGAYELWQVDAGTGEMSLHLPIRTGEGQPPSEYSSVLGAVASRDGRHLYFARHVGRINSDQFPEWTIVRRDLVSNEEEVIVSAPRSPRPDLVIGTAFRPAVSPDGRFLVYGARDRGATGLRLLDLETREDRWLAFPVQADDLQAGPWRDLLPRHAFTPDGRALIANIDGGIVRIDIATGDRTPIPFRARTDLPIGPSTRQAIREESGPVRVRLVQDPVESPDGRRLAFSALGTLYVMPLDGSAPPRAVAAGFQPRWSPDGSRLAFVRWTARDAGHVWTVGSDGSDPRRISEAAGFYTSPVFTPDGGKVLALRSSHAMRMRSYMEYGPLRQAELVRLPAGGGPASVVARGTMGGTLHFAGDPSEVLVRFGDGLNAVPLDGSPRRLIVNVTGPGWYFAEGRGAFDDIRVSPDGRHALVQIVQQAHLIALPEAGRTVDLADPDLPHRRLTAVGADFLGWSADGSHLAWAVGSTYFRQPLAALPLPASGARQPAPVDLDLSGIEMEVVLPRALPRGTIVLRGGTAVTMRGDEVVADADIVVTGDRIAGIGPRGTVPIPPGATVRDVSGSWIIPGLIETHDHLADMRRNLLDFESWGALANLAYGVTTAFDPSTLTIDMIAYEDAIDAGLMVGSRIRSTGTALFSFNAFRSYEEVVAVLRRYRDHYRLGNIKMYRTGNRRVRQWIAMAARELGLHPAAEGALAMKLDLTQIIDGYAAHEHALPAVPLYEDVVALMAGSGVGYSATLQIGNGGAEAQDYFIVRDRPASDPKLNRFVPDFIVDMKMRVRTFREPGEYRFPRVAESVARVQRAGGIVGMGSHGENPGLGYHWELQAHAMGGMSPAEVLRAATIGSAQVIGRDADLGSLEPGKLADLVILDRNPLEDVANALAIRAVMLGGRLRDGDTMDEIWPEARPLHRRWYCDTRPPGAPDPCAAPQERSR
ncbi:amidohydrolase family protein [Sphingosinicella terrae]|uniref:amidohydrolase family protein n=1 Tax=Sphingosinicella terrae TaxID=2172047 RepID=UPI000E0DA0AE|nr:amidohydrolase family protein [Sphingosinicella terrae]